MATSTHETLTVGASSVPLTASVYAALFAVNSATITIESANIRFWIDGTAPTASVGHLANSGDVVKLSGQDIKNFNAIATSGTATLYVTYS